MLKKVVGIVGGVALLFVAMSDASAFEQEGIAAGKSETSIFGDLSSTSSSGGGASTSIVILGVSYGYFVTDPIEVGASLFGNATSSGAISSGSMSYSAFGKYHFLGNPTNIPYVGANLGITSPSVGPSNTTYGVTGGVKMFQSESTAFGLEGYYRIQSVTGGNSLNSLGATFTVNFYM